MKNPTSVDKRPSTIRLSLNQLVLAPSRMTAALQFLLSCLAVATLIVACCTAESEYVWLSLLLVQPLIVFGVAWIFRAAIPPELQELAVHNSFRNDGSKSPRREEREKRAMLQYQLVAAAFAALLVIGLDWIFIASSELKWFTISGWPNAALAFCLWLVASGIAFPYFYYRMIHYYQRGIDDRYHEYVELDNRVKSQKSSSKRESAA